jgi:hypothetical protein
MHRGGQFEGKLDFKKIWKLYFGSKMMNLKCLGFGEKKCTPEVFCQNPFHWHCLNTIENIVIINWFFFAMKCPKNATDERCLNNKEWNMGNIVRAWNGYRYGEAESGDPAIWENYFTDLTKL